MTKARPLGCIITTSFTLTLGVILLVTASIYTNQTAYTSRIWGQIYSLSVYSLVISIFAILISIGLLYVVIREYPALTALFSGLLIFVAFLAVICGVILITGRSDLGNSLKNQTAELVRNYSDATNIQSSKEIVTKLQKKLHCCGAEGPSDWKSQIHDEISVPDSCCMIYLPDCGKGALINIKNIYLRGCTPVAFNHLYHKYDALIGINFALVILALIAGIFGIIYERYIREQYQSV